MKLKKKPRLELHYESDNIVIPCEKGQAHELNELLGNLNIDLEKDYTITIKVTPKKRSNDANSLLWVLIGKLGEKLNKSDNEVYRELIRDNGVFEILPIKQEAINAWIKQWSYRGRDKKVNGWVCEDLGECRNLPGYHYIKSYYGSSVYDTKQMSRLIDAAIQECKDNGIPTDPPNEIERIKQLWGK